MVAGIRDVKITSGIERDGPWIAHLACFTAWPANNFHRPIIRIEHLNAAVAEFADIAVSGRIDPHIVRITQFAGPAARIADVVRNFPSAEKI